MQIQSEPLSSRFTSMRQAQNTDTHALSQLGVSKNGSPLGSTFTADPLRFAKAQLTSILSLDVKVMVKSFVIALLKMSKNKRQCFSTFRRILLT